MPMSKSHGVWDTASASISALSSGMTLAFTAKMSISPSVCKALWPGFFGAATSQSVDRGLTDRLSKVAVDTPAMMYGPGSAPRRTYDLGLKIVGALSAIIAARTKTAAFETCVRSRMGKDHYGRAFRLIRHRHAQRGRHA